MPAKPSPVNPVPLNTDKLYLRQDLSAHWHDIDNIFEHLGRLQGEVFRSKEGRRTQRVRIGDRHYFLKYHSGIGWKEIFKNLLQLRLPIISARNEWQAIQRLTEQQVDTMSLAGYGQRGWNPAHRHSFVITDELSNMMSLEHLGQQWQRQPPTFSSKRALIEKLADISRRMHEAGINHRDYYLCHFLLDRSFAGSGEFNRDTPLYLIDLHRAQLRSRVPYRWRIKDLGSLYFSAAAVPLSSTDCLRFMCRYTGLSPREIHRRQRRLWQQVERRAQALLHRENHRSAKRPESYG